MQTSFVHPQKHTTLVLSIAIVTCVISVAFFTIGASADDGVTPVNPETLSVEPTTPSIGAESIASPSIVLNPITPPQTSPASPRAPFAPGLDTTFAGVNFDTNSTQTGFVFIPPDPIAATGPSHVVSVVNVVIEWRPKNGAAGTVQSLKNFFTSLSPANFLFDPKVVYDQHASRFVVVALERQDTSRGDPVNSSRILVAVSKTSDPTTGWWFTAINSKINIGSIDRWADYPGLATDDKAIYITANMFGFAGGPYAGTRLWIINKTPFYSGGGASVGVYDPYAGGGTATTSQPAQMFGTPPGSTGTFLFSYSGLTDNTNEFVQVVRVDNPLTAPSFTQQYINVGNIDNTATGTFPGAPQSGTATTIDPGDRRMLNAVWRGNALWGTFSLIPPSGTDAGQVTAHWVKLNTSNLASLTLTDQGNVGGEDIAAGTYTYYPSVAVDKCGNMALGFAASASTKYGGAYYTARSVNDTAGTTQASSTLQAGTDYYVRTFSSGRNRWGDYSGIALDPADQLAFWLYNEYAMTRGTLISGEDGRWATQYGSLHVPNTTLTALTSAPNPSNFGQSVTFTATVSSGACVPTGNVTFYRAGVSMGTSALSGGIATLATNTIPVGTHNITATFNANTNFNASTSPIRAQTVNALLKLYLPLIQK